MTLRVASSAFLLVIVFATDHAEGQVTEFTNFAQWQAAVGDFTTIGFTGFPADTIITDQYSGLGVLFTDGNDRITPFGPSTYLIDGRGLWGGPVGGITIAFDTPQTHLAADFPGLMQIDLLIKGELFFTSSIFFPPPSGVGGFAGLVSTQQFDGAVIRDPTGPDGQVFIDDLHFGVPGPSALALLSLAGLWPAARRRR